MLGMSFYFRDNFIGNIKIKFVFFNKICKKNSLYKIYDTGMCIPTSIAFAVSELYGMIAFN